MILRPTSFATWASGPSGYVTEPIHADKLQGFLPTGIARSAYVNWLFGLAGQWHEYLEQQVKVAAYGTVVEDDFVRATGAGFTGLGNNWNVTPTGSFAFVPNNGAGMSGGALGAVNLNPGTAGVTTTISMDAGEIQNRNFRLEVITKLVGSGFSGTFAEAGLPGVCSFMATGPSMTWGLRFTPSGGSPTSVPLGSTAMNLNPVYRKFVVQRMGATMYSYIDDVQVGVHPAVAPAQAIVGVRGINTASSSISFGLDRVKLSVDR